MTTDPHQRPPRYLPPPRPNPPPPSSSSSDPPSPASAHKHSTRCSALSPTPPSDTSSDTPRDSYKPPPPSRPIPYPLPAPALPVCGVKKRRRRVLPRHAGSRLGGNGRWWLLLMLGRGIFGVGNEEGAASGIWGVVHCCWGASAGGGGEYLPTSAITSMSSQEQQRPVYPEKTSRGTSW